MRFAAWMLAVVFTCACAGCGDGGTALSGALPLHELSFDRQPPAQRSVEVSSPRKATARSADGGAVRDWRYIVVHHSATASGSAATIDREHRRRGWDGLGYHFVIDNGNGGPDGRVETGQRWRQQKWGAHTGNTPNNEYNNYGIGICLVGDFTTSMPSRAQLDSLRELVTRLAAEHDIPPQNVICHRDAPGASTECPGDALYRWVHNTLQPSLARQYAAR
jgi:N-acetyl-anhydromuramyl-L-alanine amidase AmpD